MNTEFKHYLGKLFCLVVGSSTIGETGDAAVTSESINTDATLTVFNCDGRYVKISTISGSTFKAGSYSTFAGAQERVDGCLISSVLDANPTVLYALMPQGHPDDNQSQIFAVVGLDAVTLQLLYCYELPTKQVEEPYLFYDPSQQELMLAFDNAHSVQRLAIHSTGAVSTTDPVIKLEQPFLSLFPPQVDDQGNIIAGMSIYNRQGRLVQQLKPDSILDPVLQTKFTSLTTVKGSAQHFSGAMEQSSVGDRIAFTVGWDEAAIRVSSTGVIIYDVRLARVVTSFVSAVPVAGVYAANGTEGPMLHLTPDGMRVVIEQYDWRASDGMPSMPSDTPAKQYKFRTGTIALYDADTGILTGKVRSAGINRH